MSLILTDPRFHRPDPLPMRREVPMPSHHRLPQDTPDPMPRWFPLLVLLVAGVIGTFVVGLLAWGVRVIVEVTR